MTDRELKVIRQHLIPGMPGDHRETALKLVEEVAILRGYCMAVVDAYRGNGDIFETTQMIAQHLGVKL